MIWIYNKILLPRNVYGAMRTTEMNIEKSHDQTLKKLGKAVIESKIKRFKSSKENKRCKNNLLERNWANSLSPRKVYIRTSIATMLRIQFLNKDYQK